MPKSLPGRLKAFRRQFADSRRVAPAVVKVEGYAKVAGQSRNEIISKTNEDHLPAHSLLSPLVDPEVEYSGRTQALCWWATGSCCFRPLIGRAPVPQSVPQSVSCIPHYHLGLRDFPSPVGSEDLSAWSLPDRQAVQVMVCIRGLLFGLLHASSGWSMRDAPDTVFRSALPLQTVPPRAPWLQRRYPLSSLLRAHRPIPMPPARVSCSALTTSASVRLRSNTSGPRSPMTRGFGQSWVATALPRSTSRSVLPTLRVSSSSLETEREGFLGLLTAYKTNFNAIRNSHLSKIRNR